MWIKQSHSRRDQHKRTLHVKFLSRSILAFFAFGLLDDDGLKKLSLSLFFCFEKASNSLARVAAKCRETKKKNNRGKLNNRKCQIVQSVYLSVASRLVCEVKVKRGAFPPKNRLKGRVPFFTFIFKDISFPSNIQDIIFPKKCR